MAKGAILFLHGFASSALGLKAQYLAGKCDELEGVEFHALDFNPTPSDFEYMTTTGLINRVRQYVLDHDLRNLCLIGSSFGGLVAVHYAHRFGGVDRMLLLAPALVWLSGGQTDEQLVAWQEAGALPVFHFAFQEELPLRYDLQVDGSHYLDFVPPACPVTVMHGNQDEAVPFDHSRDYAARFPETVHLVELDADHDLNGHLDDIWGLVESFLL